MDLTISGPARDEIARILEQVAKEGLGHPHNLDSAIDAIGTALQGDPMQKVIDSHLDTVYWVGDDDDPNEMFGAEGVTVVRGHFVPVTG